MDFISSIIIWAAIIYNIIKLIIELYFFFVWITLIKLLLIIMYLYITFISFCKKTLHVYFSIKLWNINIIIDNIFSNLLSHWWCVYIPSRGEPRLELGVHVFGIKWNYLGIYPFIYCLLLSSTWKWKWKWK